MTAESEVADGSASPVDTRQAYLRLSRAAPQRLLVSSLFAGFTLITFIGLFTVAPGIDHLDEWSVVLLLADIALGAGTLLFVTTALATYVAMQRIASLSAAATEALSGGGGELPQLSEADAVSLDEAARIYDEPASFIVWGLLLVVAGIILVAWHIDPAISVVLLLVLAGILFLTRALHPALREVFLGSFRQS